MAASGNDGVWEQVLADQLRQHSRLFFRLAYGILRDASAADDACQQAFLKAWERRDGLQDQPALRGWLAQVVINESLLLVRRRKVEQRAMLARTEASPVQGPERDVHRTDLRQAVVGALDQLPERTRVVVALRVMQGLTGNQVKDLLGCSASEVSRQLHGGMEQLRGCLCDWKTEAVR